MAKDWPHIGGNRLRHGHSKKGARNPTYNSWVSMKTRCLNPNTSYWPRYGGRGVTVCQSWLDSFEAFLADMGERPEGKTLDRIDNDGNYEPGNCRWATHEEQTANSRKRQSKQGACSVADCGRPARARGMCATHWKAWRRERADGPRCSEPGCPEAALVRGLCQTHYNSWHYRIRNVH